MFLTIPDDVKPSDYDKIDPDDFTQADALAVSEYYPASHILGRLSQTGSERIDSLLIDIAHLMDASEGGRDGEILIAFHVWLYRELEELEARALTAAIDARDEEPS